jgi:hypothetical protein
MKLTTIILILILAVTAQAKSVSNDVDRHDSLGEKISPEALKKQLQLKGTVYIMSPDGEVIHSVGQEMRQWKFGSDGDLTSNWYFSSKDIEPISLKQVWTVDSSGKLKVHIQQFDNKSVEIDDTGKVVNRGKPIQEKEFTLKNFEPITWVAYTNKKHRAVVRITPELAFDKEPIEIGRLPISAKEMIAADNKGFVWTPEASFSGEYITLKTSRGTIHISYLPFKGSKEIGFAEENKIRLGLGKKHYLRLISNAPFLPSGMQAKVFGRVNLSEKVAPGSTHIQSSDKEKEFLSSIK